MFGLTKIVFGLTSFFLLLSLFLKNLGLNMHSKFRFKFLNLLIIFIIISISVQATRNVSKYFPFLEKPADYVTKKKSNVSPALFLISSSSALKQNGGTIGIPELHGSYNLKDIIEGVNTVKIAAGQSSYNPFSSEPGYVNWNTKDIYFRADGKIKGKGISLGLEKNLFGTGFSVGAFASLMHINTSIRFYFSPSNLATSIQNVTQQEVDMLDRVRRSVHTELRLKGDDWSKFGIGDVDAYVKWGHLFDHVMKMKSIDMNIRFGALIPTGDKADKDYSSSKPFMGNEHWGAYADLVTEFELKQNWKLGFMAGLCKQFEKTYDMRIPIYKEPLLFSAIHGNVEVDPGLTYKLCPYFTLENITDGVHFHLRTNMVRHKRDNWIDKRSNKDVLSYLESTRSDIESVRSEKSNLSRWKYTYLTLQAIYDSVDAMKNWKFTPTFYLTYDYPFGGRNVAKTHQVSLCAELHF